MSTSPISSGSFAGLVPQPMASNASAANVRQVSIAQKSDSVAVQTDQSVSRTGQAEPGRAELEKAVKEVNEFIKPFNNSLQFNIDDDTGKTVVKVIDEITKDVIRQVPSQEMLSIAQAIDKMKGLLVQQKA